MLNCQRGMHGDLFDVFHLKPNESFFVPDESSWMIDDFIAHLKKLALHNS